MAICAILPGNDPYAKRTGRGGKLVGAVLPGPGTGWSGPPVSHGDLWQEHVLFNSTGEPRVTGVLDWEHAGFDDPVLDFVPQMRLGREYMTCMLEAYHARGGEFGPEALSRIELHLPYRELRGLCYCLETGDMREAQYCVEKFKTVLGPFEQFNVPF